MLAPKYFIYLATGPQVEPRLDISSNPRIDAGWLLELGYDEMTLFQPPLALWIAETVRDALRRETLRKPAQFSRKVKERVAGITGLQHRQDQTQKLADLAAPLPEPGELDRFLQGRCVLGTELPEVIRAAGYATPWDPEDWMQLLYLQNRIGRTAAVGYDSLGIPQCRRCGATDGIYQMACHFCQDPRCLTCTHCQTMGVAKSCTPLYYQSYPDARLKAEPLTPVFDFALTPAQQRASEAVREFMQSPAQRFLVWAVCGGGKTEVSFGVIADVLSQGGRVLVAIPRKDVVIELLPRFEKAFPSIVIQALYGGSPNRCSDARLVLATTHQCLRSYRSFDLIVLDEADAFPYQGSQMLHYAVSRALKPAGKLVMMTATPERSLIELAERGKLPYVAIPARYHRQPLIVPQILHRALPPCHPGKAWAPPDHLVRELVAARLKSRRWLLFLPTIQMIETIGAGLILWGVAQGLKGMLYHSKRSDGEAIKHHLLRGGVDFVVTSTILERGITLPDLDVAVLHADYEAVFDCRTLVQIAGRAGRTGEPAAVWFYARTTSRAMQQCCDWITRMNREGVKLGFLDPEG